MAVAYTGETLISLGTGTGAAATLPDIDYNGAGTNIMTIVVESVTAQVGDVIAINDVNDFPVIPPITIGVANHFRLPILVNNLRKGVHVQTNTGGRATVWVNRLALRL